MDQESKLSLATPKIVALLDNSRTWVDVDSAWSLYEDVHPGEEQLPLVLRFAQSYLLALENTPQERTPAQYAHWYDTVSQVLDWKHLAMYAQTNVPDTIHFLAHMAEKAGTEKSQWTGRGIAARWMQHIGQYFNGVKPSNDLYPNGLGYANTALVLLQSNICDAFKWHTIKKCTEPDVWLMTQAVPHIKKLLPAKELHAMKKLGWRTGHGDFNKALAQTYFPTMAHLMDLSMEPTDWASVETIQATVGTMVAASKKDRLDVDAAFDFSVNP